jgi:hypothetical protein
VKCYLCEKGFTTSTAKWRKSRSLRVTTLR